MTKDEFWAVLDIGAAKTVALTMHFGQDGQPCVLGSGLAATAGLHKGKVVDGKALTGSMLSALRQAESNAGSRAGSLFCIVAGVKVGVYGNRGSTAIGQVGKAICQEDVTRVLDAAKILPVNSGQTVIHAVPYCYYIDGQVVDNAVGRYGTRLEVDTAILAGASQEMAQLEDLISNLGRAPLHSWIFSGFAMARSLLAPAEEQSVLILDFGAGTTDVTLAYRKQPVYVLTLPIAGHHITNDLHIGLDIDREVAEQIKVRHGVAMAALADTREVIELADSDTKASVPRKLIADIIEARLQEILLLIEQEIQRAGLSIPSHIVIAGGTAMLPGMADLLTLRWGGSVRIAGPPHISGFPVNFYNPAFSSIAAASLLVAGREKRVQSPAQGSQPPEKKKSGELRATFSGLWKAISGK